MIETAALDFLVPSWWEIKVTVAAAMFVILSFCFFSWSGGGGGDGGGGDRAVVLENSGDGIDEKDKFCTYFVDGTVERRFSSQFCIYNQVGIVGS